MEISLDHANKANVETSKQIKRLANNLLEIDTAAEEEARARADIEDQIGISERKGTYTYSYFYNNSTDKSGLRSRVPANCFKICYILCKRKTLLVYVNISTLITYVFFFSISANVLSSEVEEARLLLDTAERARKHAEVI